LSVFNQSGGRGYPAAKLGLVAVGLLLVMGGCSGSDTASTPSNSGGSTTTSPVEATTSTRSSTTSTTSTSTSTVSSSTSSTPSGGGGTSVEEQEVIDRYVGYWDARFDANSGTPNPQDPALAEYAVDPQLAAVRAETQKNFYDGLAFRQRKDPANFRRVKVVSLEGDKAVVQECFVDDGLVVRRDDGTVVNDNIATHSVKGDLVRVDGKWRLSQAQLVQRWEGVGGCAQAS